MGSGVDGLAGMCEVSRRVAYPNIQLVRPLLACRKEQLRGMCEEEGVGWVEDPSNRELYYKRNYIRHVLENDPGLREGLYHMHNTLVDANKSLHSRCKGVYAYHYLFVTCHSYSERTPHFPPYYQQQIWLHISTEGIPAPAPSPSLATPTKHLYSIHECRH